MRRCGNKMKLCIDTNAYVRIMQKSPLVVKVIEEAERVFIPSIVLGELYAGFMMGSKYDQNCSELESFLALPGVEIAYIDKNTAQRYGILVKQLKSAGTPLPVNDIWIGASALEAGARVVSYDKHFTYIPGIDIISP
jgi:tRNA(fMet)-specific endonuclease VapC